MADAKTEIKIDVDYVGRREVNKVVRDMRKIERETSRVQARMAKGFASSSRIAGIDDQNSFIGQKFWLRLKKQVTEFDKVIQMTGKMGLKGLSLAMKGATFEMAAMAAAMVAVHAAFLLGNGAMKAMRALQGPLAAGMAGIVAAAAAASAAIREQQAAMYAYKTTSKGEFGSSLNQTRQVMRALHTDTYLASAGVETLNKAFAAVSKNSTWTMKSQQTLKGLMDFASAGQPLDQGVQKAGELIAALQNAKTSFSQTKIAAESLFPDKAKMQEAFKKLKITTKKGLQKAIDTGELAKAAGLEGQFDAVSGTLINRLKGYFNMLKQQFADLGQPLLEPIKQAANDIFNILRRGFVKISSSTRQFGMGNMLEGLVGLVQKLTDKMANFINSHVHTVEGMFDRMGRWWDRFRDGWDTVLDKLRPLIGGARVIESFFGQIWKHVKNILSSKFGDFNEWLQDNKSEVKDFGDSIGQLLENIFKLLGEFGKLTRKMLPFINDVVKGLAQIVNSLASVMGMMNSIGGGPSSALAMVFGMRGMFGGMAANKGGFRQALKMTRSSGGGGGLLPAGPVGPTVITGPAAGGMGTTQAALRGARGGVPPQPTTTGTAPPVAAPPVVPATPASRTTPAFSSNSAPLQRPEYEVFKRAPKGGTYIGEKFYRGGSFLPTSQITAAEQAYYGIGARASGMSAMSDVATHAGMVSMRTGTVLPGATTTPAAASASAFSSESIPMNRAGRPMAPPGGVTLNGRFYPQGRQLPAGFASATMTPGNTTGGGGTGGGGTGGGGTVYPQSTLMNRNQNPSFRSPVQVLNKYAVNRGGGRFSQFIADRTNSYLTAMDPNRTMFNPITGEDQVVSNMTDDELRAARLHEKTYGSKAFKKTGPGGGQQKFKTSAKLRQRAIRNRSAMESTGGRRMRGALGSAGAKMGTSVLLGMASQHMPEEARGAMAMGAMAAQINPLLGLGVAGLGTAMNARTAKGGAASGLVGGAAMGAMVGSAVPVIGTAAGAVAGAIIGVVGGAVMGAINAERIKNKKARAVAKKQISNMVHDSMGLTFMTERERKPGDTSASGLRTIFDTPMKKLQEQQNMLQKSGFYDKNRTRPVTKREAQEQIEAMRSNRGTGLTFTEKEYKDAMSRPQEYLSELNKTSATQLKAMAPLQQKYNSRMDELKRITGKSDTEINNLAASMGVNLYDSTVEFTDVVKNLGLAMVKTKEQIRAATISDVVDEFAIFDKKLQAWKTPRILDEEARAFRDLADTGGLTKTSKVEFLQKQFEGIVNLYGEGGLAIAEIEKLFGNEGKAFKKGGPLYGLDEKTFSGDPEIKAMLDTIIGNSRRKVGNTYGQQLNAVLGDDYGLSINATEFSRRVQKMSPEELVKLGRMAESGFTLPSGREGRDLIEKYGSPAKAILAMLGMEDIGLKGSGKNDPNLAATDLTTASKEVAEATKTLIGEMESFFKRDKEEKPDWFTKESFEKLIKGDDTTTPRGSTIGDTTSSRLAVTMGRHSAMDSMLTGKRTVTSAYRTTGLGSINSDHVTGRAYDLTGQNLGQYKSLVDAGGGFAEFHGVGGDRHLHVVPGSGIGDTRMPVASSNTPTSLTTGSAGGGNSYSFYINGGNNASPKEIADAVMMRIKETERSNRERR